MGATDLDAARLAALAREFHCRAYASLEEMLADPAIQVVSILTPNHLHTEAVIQAARAGKHLLVEKPPATSLRDLDAMQAACLAAGVKAGVVFQCRTLRAVVAIRGAIRAGRFGKILHADAFMKWYRPVNFYRMDAWRSLRRSGAGVTLQQAIHYIDMLQYLVGPVARVRARMTNLAHPEIQLEDTLLAWLTFRNGAHGVVEATTAFWPGADVRVEVNGEDGTAIMIGERIDTWKFRDTRAEDESILGYGNAAAATGATGMAGMSFREHQAVIEDMVDAIERDREPMVTLAAARVTLECALALYVSAERNSSVDLPLDSDPGVW
jgi:predicted dehydrogenase